MYDHNNAVIGGYLSRHAEPLAQQNQWEILTAHLQQPFLTDKAAQHLFVRTERFHYRAQRQDINLVAHFHQHAVENCQRQRQNNANGGARARRGKDIDVPAHRQNISSYHVHANAAPGDVRHAFCRRETGGKNQHPHVFIAH